MLKDIYQETKEKMGKSISSLETELNRVRTGRASMSLLDSVKVNYYSTLTPLNQMVTISILGNRLIAIQPWDTSALKEIEKGILKANLDLTLSNDGKIIRITIPPLTEERRKTIVKQVHKICEDHKVALRNLRRDSNDFIKSLKKESKISEDDSFKAQDKIQKITDKKIKIIDDMYKKKESEILEI